MSIFGGEPGHRAHPIFVILVSVLSSSAWSVPKGAFTLRAGSGRVIWILWNPAVSTPVAFESLNFKGFQFRHIQHAPDKDILTIPYPQERLKASK